jgi:SIR2-like domain
MERSDTINWDLLLSRIKNGRCTPVVGAGASASFFPVGSQIAKEWAEASKYPFPDATELARVAQYLAVTGDAMSPKEEISQRLASVPIPTPISPDEPHQVLAALDLPIYITTNYDGLMGQALREQGKEVREGLCLWNDEVARNPPDGFALAPDYRPTVDAPLVYHLHGHHQVPESLVLTEDDYIDFLIRMSRQEDLLPPYVREAFTRATILFVGYRIADPNFRVLFRSIVVYMQHALKRSHFSVQSPPRMDSLSEESRQRAKAYLSRYFDLQRISVFWGYSHEFTRELSQRWRALDDGA